MKEIGETGSSGLNVWPTRENPSMYKFNSFYMELKQEKSTLERQTYSLLEWVGDVGGLYDGLSIIGHFLTGPIAVFAVKVDVLS